MKTRNIFLKKVVDIFSFCTLRNMDKSINKSSEELRILQFKLFFAKGMENGLSRGLGAKIPELTFKDAYEKILNKPLDEDHSP